MDKLLHHYEQELNRLRQAARRYSESFPEIAAALELEAGTSSDPEVERLLQSVALLNAATQQLIEEGRSDFHKALLQTLQPHYLRPVPSCGIVQVNTSAARPNEISSVLRLPRGTVLRCDTSKYTTAYEICIAPIAIVQVKFQSTIDVPPALRLPVEASSALCITLECTASSAAFDEPPLPEMKICIDGCAGLLDAMLTQSLSVCIEAGGTWQVLPQNPFALAGFGKDEALLPAPQGDQSHRLLTEFVTIPQKFEFCNLNLAALAPYVTLRCRCLTLYIVLPNHPAQLRKVCAQNLRLACSPVINLHRQASEPIRLDGRKGAYPVTPSQAGCEIYSIDKVTLLNRGGDKEFLPFHGNDHCSDEPFWLTDESEGFAIKLVNREQEPIELGAGTLSVQLTCINSDVVTWPEKLTTEVSAGGLPIHFLHTPTLAYCLPEASQLCQAMHSTSITLEDIKEHLRLHGYKGTDGIKSLSSTTATAWIEHPAGRLHMNGNEYTLTIDEDLQQHHSICVLAEVLAMLFAEKAFENRFIRVCLQSGSSQILAKTKDQTGKRKLI